MTMPGFTAASVWQGAGSRATIVPALRGPGGGSYGECLTNCRENCGNNKKCRDNCEKTCHDRYYPDPTPTGPESEDCFLCQLGCALWKIGCKASALAPFCEFIPCDCPSCD